MKTPKEIAEGIVPMDSDCPTPLDWARMRNWLSMKITAAITKEIDRRIAELEEAVRVLTEEAAAHRSRVPLSWTDQESRRYDINRRKKDTNANHIARAAIEKAKEKT